MGLWYWELMSRPDPAVLPVGTLHSLEWFWVSRRIFIYSHHNTFVFSLRCPSVCPSIGLLTTFSGFLHICWQVTGKEWHRVRNADVSRWLTLGQHWCRWVSLSFHAFVRPSNHHGLGFVYCIQSAWKKWPTIWHADVSRWLTLSIHGCLWILLLVCLSVHLSVCSFTAFSGGCAFADKSLGTNGIKFDMLMYLLV